MNERDHKSRKGQGQTILRHIQYHPNIKSGSAALPLKQPPNISSYFKKQCSEKKQITFFNSKENKHYRDINYQTMGVEKIKGRSIIMSKGSLQRTSYGKIEENKIRKTKKQYHYSKPIKQKKHLNTQNKEARELRSTIEEDHSETLQRVRHNKWNAHQTQIYHIDKNHSKFTLACKQKLIRKSKKAMTPDQSDTISHLFMSSKTVTKTPAEQIAEFESQIEKIKVQQESESVFDIALKEQGEYSINPNFLKKQYNLTWIRRAIVINWMMEVLSGFGSKRDTFAVAVGLLDRYLQVSDPIPLQELQLVAGTAMYIANKVEDHLFSVRDVSESTGDQYSADQILKYQFHMISKLQWKLNPPTVNMWANRFALQWDMYLDSHKPFTCEALTSSLPIIKFKTEDVDGYNNFRELMQYVDFSLLEIHTLQYHFRELAASFIYIILNIRLKFFTREEIVSTFPVTSKYLIEDSDFNEYYNEFLYRSFGFNLQDLLPTVQYCSTFLILPLCFKLPPAVDDESQGQITFSEFCSYQTCNQHNLSYLQIRTRDFD